MNTHTTNLPAIENTHFPQLPHHLLPEPEPRTDRRLRSMFPYASGSGKPGIWSLISGTHYLEISGTPDGFFFDCPDEALPFWKQYFDLGTDYGSFIASIRADDAYLAAAADAGSGIRILRQDLWEMMITFLISQQKTIPKIREAVEALAKIRCEENRRPLRRFHPHLLFFSLARRTGICQPGRPINLKTRLPRQIHPPPHPGCPRRNRILRIPRSPAAGRSHDRTLPASMASVPRSPTASASSDSTTSTPSRRYPDRTDPDQRIPSQTPHPLPPPSKKPPVHYYYPGFFEAIKDTQG